MPNPALHIITSSRPNRSTARVTSACMSASRVTSAAIGSGVPPPAAISDASASRRSMRRAHITTEAPSRASRSAVARPIPADAPVIATTRFEDMSETAYSFQLSAFSFHSLDDS